MPPRSKDNRSERKADAQLPRRIERSRKKPAELVQIAEERIEILFDEAKKRITGKDGLELLKENRIKYANRYVQLARKIAMRYNIKLPTDYRRMFCKKCKRYLYPGITSQTRVKNGVVKVKCGQCGKVSEYGTKN